MSHILTSPAASAAAVNSGGLSASSMSPQMMSATSSTGTSRSNTNTPIMTATATSAAAAASSSSLSATPASTVPSAPTKQPTEPIPAKSTVIKTDKPRPHVCATCTRSFARLEHLKRHERSHTKEKPFQCPVCERCFSRRDLLLRHKQKLHASLPGSPKPRGGQARRRSSVQIKKEPNGSTNGSINSGANPDVMSAQNVFTTFNSNDSKTAATAGSLQSFDPITGSNVIKPNGEIDEHDLDAIIENAVSQTSQSLEFSNILRGRVSGDQPTRLRHSSFSAVSATSYSKDKDIEAIQSHLYPISAPSEVGFSTPQLLPSNLENMDIEDFLDSSNPLFINPQQLVGQDKEFNSNNGLNFSGQSNLHNGINFTSFPPPLGATHGGSTSVSTNNMNINNMNIRKPRPSIRSNSIDDNASSFTLEDDMSPSSMLAFDSNDFAWLPPTDANINRSTTTPQSVLQNSTSFSPTSTQGLPYNSVDSPLSLNMHNVPNTGSNHSLTSFPSGVRHSSTTTGVGSLLGVNSPHSTNSETSPDNHNGFMSNHPSSSTTGTVPLGLDEIEQGIRRESISVSAPLQPSNANNSLSVKKGLIMTAQLRLHILNILSTPTPFSSNQIPQLPSVQELQRYINAYTENFGKHLPFLHHTLEFSVDNVALALGMAAIGALYSFERSVSVNIFEASRSCIHIYLESRREKKSSGSTAANSNGSNATPLWLVQALVLGVIYGLFSGESLANEIAVAQANAVISLAKSAGLHLPAQNFLNKSHFDMDSLQGRWLYFIAAQERVRTMHVVHIISCLLSTSYNLAPALENSDIKCGSPCDESLWIASTHTEWSEILSCKGLNENSQIVIEGLSFTDCLQRLSEGETLAGKIPQFTLLSFMFAIHVEINTRKSAHDRKFFESRRNNSNFSNEPGMVAVSALSIHQEASNTALRRELSWLEQEKYSIEGMLRAWETTWSLSPLASLNPSSQYGPLMSDSIPLSSLAHVRLYLDLRRVKEHFWKRDFAGMGRELDSIAPPVYYESVPVTSVPNGNGNSNGNSLEQYPSEKLFDGLLEAASYSADTLSLWEKHSVKWTMEKTAAQTFAHTIVALFDCGLVVSEYLYRLEKRQTSEWREEDRVMTTRLCKILGRIVNVVGPEGLDLAKTNQAPPTSNDSSSASSKPAVAFSVDINSYRPFNSDGPRLSIISLHVVSKLLTKAYVWPFVLVMSEALHMRAMQIKRSSAGAS